MTTGAGAPVPPAIDDDRDAFDEIVRLMQSLRAVPARSDCVQADDEFVLESLEPDRPAPGELR